METMKAYERTLKYIAVVVTILFLIQLMEIIG